MVPSSALTVTTSGERLLCGGFSIGETIRFRSLEFIADRFDRLSLSHMGNGLDAVVMDSAHGGPPSPQQTMMGDSIKGSPVASDEEGRINLPPR
jgi:hypothetical protein